jgi:hypothetical protein
MSDFKWEMQERIDGGMSPDDAYEATRGSYLDIFDTRDKFGGPSCGPNGCDVLDVCSCTCDNDCECKAREVE